MDSPIGLSDKAVEILYKLSDELKQIQDNIDAKLVDESAMIDKNYYGNIKHQAENMMRMVDKLAGRMIMPGGLGVKPLSDQDRREWIARIQSVLDYKKGDLGNMANISSFLCEGSELNQALRAKLNELLQPYVTKEEERRKDKGGWRRWFGS